MDIADTFRTMTALCEAAGPHIWIEIEDELEDEEFFMLVATAPTRGTGIPAYAARLSPTDPIGSCRAHLEHVAAWRAAGAQTETETLQPSPDAGVDEESF